MNLKTSERGFFSHEGLCDLTCWKQLRTLGSMLLPPKAATSPSCRGIWIASWSSRPSCLWSHISVGPATSLKRSATPTRGSASFHFHVRSLLFRKWSFSTTLQLELYNFGSPVMVTDGHCLTIVYPHLILITLTTFSWSITIQMRKVRLNEWNCTASCGISW